MENIFKHVLLKRIANWQDLTFVGTKNKFSNLFFLNSNIFRNFYPFCLSLSGTKTKIVIQLSVQELMLCWFKYWWWLLGCMLCCYHMIWTKNIIKCQYSWIIWISMTFAQKASILCTRFGQWRDFSYYPRVFSFRCTSINIFYHFLHRAENRLR